MGLVARDERGAVSWLWRSPIQAASAVEAELKGVYLALLVAKFRGLSKVVVEGDNKSLMESLESSKVCPFWFLLPVFQSILSCCCSFVSVSFFWISRDSNRVAHALCQWAARDGCSGFCTFGDTPTLVRSYFDDDLSSSMSVVPSSSANLPTQER